MTRQTNFQGYCVDVQARCLRKVDTEESIPFESPQGLHIRALMELTYTDLGALENELRDGQVIELDMPFSAQALLLLDEHGKYCFIWETCFHKQDEDQACFPFETVEQLLLFVFSCLYSQRMNKQEAMQWYGNSSMKTMLSHLTSPEEDNA